MLSLVIPTRNESDAVNELVRRVTQALGSTPHELLFMDDSDDDTPDRIERDMIANLHIRLFHRAPDARAGGYASAVVDGIHHARA